MQSLLLFKEEYPAQQGEVVFKEEYPPKAGEVVGEYMEKRLNNLIGLKKNRKALRNHLTPAEARLWIYLKDNKLGEKFRRQHSVGYYILDFYCPKKKLAVELDGSPHDTEEGYQHDQTRTEDLNKLGVKVIRFENKDVIKNVEGVVVEIKKYLV